MENNNNMSNQELLEELKKLRAQVINSSKQGFNVGDNTNATNKNGSDNYGISIRKRLSNGGEKYYGNQDNGFINAFILGIIVFFTETLFLLIGYWLFK